MKKTDFKFKNLLYDNRFLMVISVFIAIAIWAVVVVVYSPETEKTIENVPVTIEPSGLAEANGLKAYFDADYRIDVTVSGKRIVVDSAEEIKDDLVVYANTSFVSVPGTHTLKLEVSSLSASPQYEIVSFSIEEIDVYFDTETESVFKIEPQITAKSTLVADGYIAGNIVVDGFDTVTITGPSGEVNAIEHVYAKGTVEDPITQNTVVQGELSAVDEDGNSVKFIDYSRDTLVNVNIPVSKQAELMPKVDFTNIPSAYLDGNLPFEVEINPASALFAVDETKLSEDSTEISVGKIDFSQIKSGENSFVIDTSELAGVTVLNGSSAFNASVNASGVTEKTVVNAAPPSGDAAYQSVPEGKTVQFVSYNFDSVTVVGPDSSLADYNSDNLNLIIDLYEIGEEDTGTFTVPVRMADDDCWLYGEYTATVIIA